MRVLVIDAIAPEGLAFLRDHGFEVDEVKKPSAEELSARIGLRPDDLPLIRQLRP